MQTQYFKAYSPTMGREMECKIYGHAGKPILFVPCQAGRFYDFENFHMSDVFSPYIDAGRVMVFAVDTIDNETWAGYDRDARARTGQHERWYHYVVDEFVPFIFHIAGEHNGVHQLIATFGCSLGALHASNFFFRRPDLFDGTLALSGLYDSRAYFGDYMDDLLYQNSPCDYLSHMSPDHPYIGMYNERKIIIVVGQGAWEDIPKASTAWLGRVLWEKGIHASVNFWGEDVCHDWDWWYKQTAYYLPFLLGDR